MEDIVLFIFTFRKLRPLLVIVMNGCQCLNQILPQSLFFALAYTHSLFLSFHSFISFSSPSPLTQCLSSQAVLMSLLYDSSSSFALVLKISVQLFFSPPSLPNLLCDSEIWGRERKTNSQKRKGIFRAPSLLFQSSLKLSLLFLSSRCNYVNMKSNVFHFPAVALRCALFSFHLENPLSSGASVDYIGFYVARYKCDLSVLIAESLDKRNYTVKMFVSVKGYNV